MGLEEQEPSEGNIRGRVTPNNHPFISHL